MFDAIIKLHPINKKVFNDFFIGKWKWIVYVLNAYLFILGKLYFHTFSG